VKLTPARGTSLEGFVHDVEGKPVPNADVRVLAEPDDVELAHLSTSEGGLFTAQAIPAGRYSVVATVGEGGRGRAVGYEHPAAERADVRVCPARRWQGASPTSTASRWRR
jgi:hypothetical protein